MQGGSSKGLAMTSYVLVSLLEVRRGSLLTDNVCTRLCFFFVLVMLYANICTLVSCGLLLGCDNTCIRYRL